MCFGKGREKDLKSENVWIRLPTKMGMRIVSEKQTWQHFREKEEASKSCFEKFKCWALCYVGIQAR